MNKLAKVFKKLEGEKKDSINESPEKRYTVFFTPRSGSTLLTHLLHKVGLGEPHEWLNPELVAGLAKPYGKCSPEEYWNNIQRDKADGLNHRIFGMEITFFQYMLAAGVYGDKFLFDDDMMFFYLYREDFLAQAISLYKGVELKVFHSLGSEKIDDGYDKDLKYDADKIEYWARHLLQQEYGFENLIKMNKLNVKKFSYESLCSARDLIVHGISSCLDVKISNGPLAEVPIYKIPKGRTGDFYDKFMEERGDFVKEWQAKRGLEAAT
jgi:LPS sulfotransferase NodH